MLQVDKNSTPPVCKIMDYHKEMYKKKENVKERAKSKVRFAMINAVILKICCEVSWTVLILNQCWESLSWSYWFDSVIKY